MAGKAVQAVIFDLDGVLADTATLHCRAWRRLADEIGVPFDERVNERLKGIDRMTSLEIILEQGGRSATQAEKAQLAERKNSYYRDLIGRLTPGDLLPGALDALSAVRAAGLKAALASASRNAPMLLRRLDIASRFDYIADPAKAAPKPDPALFLAAARGVGATASDCIGVEDAVAGVRAIKAAGMVAVGIGDPAVLDQADHVVPTIADFHIQRYLV